MAEPKKKQRQPSVQEVKAEPSKILDPEYRVSKIIVHPSRKIGLKNYSSVELSAGMEITFTPPQKIDSPLITEAFEQATAKLQQEFRRQKDAFGTKKKEGESNGER